MADKAKIDQLKVYLEGFAARLDNMDPEQTSLEDVDQLLNMIEKMEEKLK